MKGYPETVVAQDTTLQPEAKTISGALSYVIRLMMGEDARHRKLGRPPMNVEEMRFVIGGILGWQGEQEFDAIVAEIKGEAN